MRFLDLSILCWGQPRKETIKIVRGGLQEIRGPFRTNPYNPININILFRNHLHSLECHIDSIFPYHSNRFSCLLEYIHVNHLHWHQDLFLYSIRTYSISYTRIYLHYWPRTVNVNKLRMSFCIYQIKWKKRACIPYC